MNYSSVSVADMNEQHAANALRDLESSLWSCRASFSEFVEHYNQHPRPFICTATAESILAKLERLCRVLGGTSH